MGNFANFYNSQNEDRPYDASSFEEWLKPFFKNGVFQGELQVTALSGMQISVAIGNAYINGKTRKFDAATEITVEPAHATLKRIDNIVVRRDDSERNFFVDIVKGVNADTPVAPVPTRTAVVHEIVLAQIYVGASATVITQSNITDTRMDTNLCGYVVGAVEQIDFDQIVAQFNAWQTIEKANFYAWVQTLHDKLDTETAGHLQNEIDDIYSKYPITEMEYSFSIPSTNWVLDATSGMYQTTVNLPIASIGNLTTAKNKIFCYDPSITAAQKKVVDKYSPIAVQSVVSGSNNVVTFRAMKQPTETLYGLMMSADYQA